MTQFDTPDDAATQPFSPPGAPPPTPGQLAVPPRRSSWPIVVGIIAIVFGALGALGELCWIAARL